MSGWRSAVLVALAALALALSGCGADQKTVTGFITDLQASSFAELASLDLRDEAGTTRHFKARGAAGLTPSHLTEHMVQALPVTVTYHEENGTLIIDKITD